MTPTEHWKSKPERHDYPAAASYLSLVFARDVVDAVISALRQADLEHWKAKDLLRASSLPILPPQNFHVAKDLKKVQRGGRLSPVLLVRGDLCTNRPLVVADGYHRICASYHLDEDADIPCHIATIALPANKTDA